VLIVTQLIVAAALWQSTRAGGAGATVWITSEEAQLPPYQGIPRFKTRGISLGPRIVVLAPPANGEAFLSARPVALHVRFEPVSNVPIDIHTLRVTYLRLLGIDITDRVRPYVNDHGIDIDNAEIPPGEHRIELQIGDREGHVSDEILKLVVK
jgi:hypothetical protein